MQSLLISLSRACWLLALWAPSHAICGSYCKPVPSSADWPSTTEWRALNRSVSGRLIAVTPPGAVCHSDHPLFNGAACAYVQSQWTNSSYHGTTPVSVGYNDDTCLPLDGVSCSVDGYPAYIIAATSAADVQAGVRFAYRTGVRLTVKSTGHDVPGRSSGAGALNIWTHNIQGIKVDFKDSRAEANGGVAAIKIAAGMRVADILNAAALNNLTVVTGADQHVGICGWVTGAGHGPISARYGLGADQVLEMDVVTADGTLLTTNEHSHPDLFWALRGGGGSTFGVLTSVTVRAFPPISLISYVYAYNTTARSETFWNLAATWHQHIPRIVDEGGMGYYYIVPRDANEPDPSIRGKVLGLWMFPERSQAQAWATIAPLDAAIRAANWTDQVAIDNHTTAFADFTSYWLSDAPDAVGHDGRVGSRLFDKESLTRDTSFVSEQLQKALPGPDANSLLGHAVAGPAVHNVKIPGGSNAVNPAWRKSYAHAIVPAVWTPLDEIQKQQLSTQLTDVQEAALKAWAPNTGAYVSEADPTEVDWQSEFWGSNYAQLLELKTKWDPTGVFWCKPCVGHELWTVDGGDGIGQSLGSICRT